MNMTTFVSPGLDQTSSITPAVVRRLLLVDDEPNILSALRRLLRKEGYEIRTADSGQEALDIMESWPPDVIVTDQRMPGMSGVSFLRESLSVYPDAIRIVLSGYTELESVTSAINDGAVWKFLTKPWEDARLLAVIAEAFHTKELADENLRLRGAVAKACEQLEIANTKLSSSMEEHVRQRETARAQTLICQEIFDAIPAALLAVGSDGMVANINAEARLACGGVCMLGKPIDEVLSMLNADRWVRKEIVMGRTSSSNGKLIALLPVNGEWR